MPFSFLQFVEENKSGMTYLDSYSTNFKSKKAIHNCQPFKENNSMKKKYQTEQTEEFL